MIIDQIDCFYGFIVFVDNLSIVVFYDEAACWFMELVFGLEISERRKFLADLFSRKYTFLKGLAMQGARQLTDNLYFAKSNMMLLSKEVNQQQRDNRNKHPKYKTLVKRPGANAADNG